MFFGMARAVRSWEVRGKTVSEEKSTAILHMLERRVERRILVHVPVEITKMDSKGQPFKDRTIIEDVNDFGCRFSTRGPVKQGDTVAVKILGHYGNDLVDEESRLYEIILVAEKDRASIVGARLLHGEKLANVKFPPEYGGRKTDPK